MSLPLPAAVSHRGREHFLLGCNGSKLPSWPDFGLPQPGWNGYRQTFEVQGEELVVSRILLARRRDDRPAPIDGVEPRYRDGWESGWVYDGLARPARFDGWLLFGSKNLSGDRLASMPVPYCGDSGVYFELGFVEGTMLEEIDLTADIARLFAPEVEMKRKRVRDPELEALLDRLEARYRIRPF